MNRILEVCLVASMLVSTITPYSIAQTPAMTRGISVQMSLANSAESQPDADQEDARIVTVTATGDVDFGSDPISLADLAQKVRSTPFLRRQKLYIKADARITYAKVLQVLNAARTDGIAPLVLLTAQSESSRPATIAPPKGLEVLRSTSNPFGGAIVAGLDDSDCAVSRTSGAIPSVRAAFRTCSTLAYVIRASALI